jgi:hypothetical protein
MTRQVQLETAALNDRRFGKSGGPYFAFHATAHTL